MSEISIPNDILSEREQSVLRHVVQHYIRSATPVGSRFLSKRFEEVLSPATIRNVMYDLEERGLLSHPHTSAGRVPTDNGYRYYVDYLMEIERLTEQERSIVQQAIPISPDPDEILRETSKLLGKISSQLSVVTSPHLGSGIFEKLELVPVSSSKLLVIISIRSGLVRTIMMEIGADISRDVLDHVGSLLNERLTGLTLRQIRDSFAQRLRDLSNEETGLIRMFIDSVDLLFNDPKDKLHIGGTNQIIDQPEFIDPKNFRSVIEMVENEAVIIHLLEKHDELAKDFVVTIGAENNDATAQDYSIVTTTYNVNGAMGRVGVIGPKRMNYSRLIPLVEHVAKTIVAMLKG